MLLILHKLDIWYHKTSIRSITMTLFIKKETKWFLYTKCVISNYILILLIYSHFLMCMNDYFELTETIMNMVRIFLFLFIKMERTMFYLIMSIRLFCTIILLDYNTRCYDNTSESIDSSIPTF